MNYAEQNPDFSAMNPDDQGGHAGLANFPVLGTLGLTATDLTELRHQGFVSRERRGKRTYYKLRFRSGGGQAVRYVGDAERAAAVRRELSVLQRTSRLRKELKSQAKVASRALRTAKKSLEPILNAHGRAFHGLAIRKPRRPRQDVSQR